MTYAADVSSSDLPSGLREHVVPNVIAGVVSWGAIIAGAIAAVATTLILLALGAGIGFSMISPWSGAGATAGTVGVSAVIGLVVVQWISSGLGGFLAGRLGAKFARRHPHDVFFRDTADGFLSWAVATIVGVVLFASIAASGISGVTKGATAVASAAAAGAANATSGSDANGYFLDTLFRSANPSDDKSDPRAETGRIILRSTHDGQVTLSPDDKAYLSQLVANRTGLSQADAAQRVDTVVAQINDASVKLRQAADAARKAAAKLAMVTALSMLIGAFIASAAGGLGGSIRQEY